MGQSAKNEVDDFSTIHHAISGAECYHYLLDAAVKLYQLGYDWSTPDHGPLSNTNRVCGLKTVSLGSHYITDHLPQWGCILLGIEGTTTPVSFVNHVLLSTCANDRLVKHSPYGNYNVLHSKDHNMAGMVFADVPKALARWHASGIKVYVFSCFCREVQHLLFGNSNHGDLRKYLSGYFDTTLGPADMLYMTDNIHEALAARAAGLEVIIVIRPGHEPLPESHGFTVVESLLEIC